MAKPVPIPFPLSSFPGASPQESAGRLINAYAEPLGENGPAKFKLVRSAGLSQHATTANSGYRGGLIVNNLSYETWANNASTVDASGNVTSIGNFPGTKKVSIARNQSSPTPDVVAVDIDNGAYVLGSANGTYFTGVPTAYNGGGALPQPNSVCFQDGYFFFTIAAGQVYASPLNGLTINALTFITCQAKADVTLLRGIAFSGLLLLFTTGSCEVWQDAANPAPAFPYGRIGVLEFGLIQPAAIAGWETGFSELIWVAQDFGVHWMTAGSLSQIKISPPDLDRLIEAEVRVGNTLEAGCYVVAGKKFWVLSSPDWTWEFNLETKKWSERQSLTSGVYGRWRATGGHPAFGKWLVGDKASGNLLYLDDANYTSNGSILLYRIESGPVKDFPSQVRVARADFDFVTGAGQATRALVMTVLGAAAGNNGVVRLTVNNTAQVANNDTINVAGVTGTTEANGTWLASVIDAQHIELKGSAFKNAYVSGGAATDVTSPANAVAPVVAISMSRDGGVTWGNPLIRSLGPQGRALRVRVSVKNMGLSGPAGVRWRLDVTDPVNVSLLGGTQSSELHPVGA
ncbi:MAG: hypothetical protein JO107_10255 [Hyphomicrobiales bacterium]|nr:hypothetical protein [Hyphomicrobiales bacterium]MBV8663472.1 hypothetical protein [Hyphomicrobiales bacterium]